MRTRRFILLAVVAGLTLAVGTPTTSALGAGPTPTDHDQAFVSIEEGPSLTDPTTIYVQLRYTCYGDPTTVDATLTAGATTAGGSAAIPCQGAVELPVGLRLTVPEGSEGFAPGVYLAGFRADIPGQASLSTEVKIEGPAASATVTLTADASPDVVARGRRITVVGSVRRGIDLVSLRTTLEFRPDGGHYRRIRSVTSSDEGILQTKVRARRSGTFRFRYAGDSTTSPATSNGDHVVVRPRSKGCDEPYGPRRRG